MAMENMWINWEKNINVFGLITKLAPSYEFLIIYLIDFLIKYTKK